MTPQGFFSGWAFLDQYRNSAVDALGDLGVSAGAEDRAGACVGVEKCEVFRGEREPSLWFIEVGSVEGEEHELGLVDGALIAGQRQQAELDATVNALKDLLSILEVEQAGQVAPLDNVLEEELGGVVGSDARRHDHTNSPDHIHCVPHGLGEDGVGVHIAAAAQWIPAGPSKNMARPFSLSDGCLEFSE